MKKLATRAFLAGDRVGVHVLPAHYYSAVASRRALRLTEQAWRRPLDPIPFGWDLDAQASWVTEHAGRHAEELPLDALFDRSGSVGGFRYGPLEAQMLYAFLRSRAPARVVEIGSGSSTLVMSEAVRRNAAEGRPATAITACDPYTAERVRGLPYVEAKRVDGLSVDEDVLSLRAGDLLFIDSTHVLRTGSELAHLYLELVPRLASGVVVHVHDVYLPYLYAPDVYASMFDWQETAFVAALLTGNARLKVLASMSGLHHGRQSALRSAFPEYRPREIRDGIDPAPGADGHFPSSLWLEVAAP